VSESPQSQRHDEHYLRDVTALGDTREVMTRQAIFSRTGIKLVQKGVRMDSRLYERLMQHKLKPPLEQCLQVADAVGARELLAAAAKLLESDRGYSLLRASAARPKDLLAALEAAPLDDSLAVRLTVMQERRAPMFEHALGVSLLASAIARRGGIVGGELARIAGAGLYHDLGEMHLDPELLAAPRALSEAERRHIYAHPLTSFLILQESAACSGALAEAALEHHERLDGSGYPRGIRGEEMGPHGRVLAIAELAAVFLAQPLAGDALRRLPVVIKLNHRRFDRAAATQLLTLAQTTQPPAAAGAGEDVAKRFRGIQEVMLGWRALRESGRAASTAFDELSERMVQLERSLIEAGFDPLQVEALANTLDEDPASREELAAAARELAWLIEEIAHNLLRREDAPSAGPLAEWAERALRTLTAR
jgi:HD-GYP domain-containing protein (c-di-GMP phosphodiesterase class II)